jgi:hypothetical protein
MINANVKRILLYTTIALGAAGVVGSATAQPPQAAEMYHYYYVNQYDDEVGQAADECHYSGITRASHMIYGVKTDQFTTEIYAYCRNGQLTLE